MMNIFFLLAISILGHQNTAVKTKSSQQTQPPRSGIINIQNEWTDYKIDRTGWQATANSEECATSTTEGSIANIINGNINSIWHSQYGNCQGHHDERTSKNAPFIIKINLAKETTFRAFAYTPRQNGANGRFKHYEFYSAMTEEELNAKIASNDYLAKGDIDTTVSLSTLVVFHDLETAQWVALLSVNYVTYGTCAEFNLYSDGPNYLQTRINEETDITWQLGYHCEQRAKN